MQPIKDYLFDPDPDIGGATVPLVGPPGVGKTVGLSQIALEGLSNDQVVLWRGTKQNQWIYLAANNEPITVWNHEGIENFETFITADQPGAEPEYINLEEKDNIQVKTWKSPEELLNRLDHNRVNVVNVPGLQGDTAQTDYHMYFFRKTWIEIIDQLIERKWLSFVRLIIDEIGDLFPCQQQLRKPFYKLVAYQLPPKLSQLRKQNCFLYAAAHSTHDMHYFVWKIKSNSIIYMSNATVKKSISPSIDQDYINNLDRGEFAMPPKADDKFNMPKKPETLDWIPEDTGKEFRSSWTSNPPNLLEDEEDQKSEAEIKKELCKNLYEDTDLSQDDLANGLNMSKRDVNTAVNA